MVYERPPLTFREQFPDRDEIEYQEQRKENSSFLGMAEKLAVIGIGARVLSRNVFKLDIAGYAAHYLGKFYQDSYSTVASAGRAVRKNPFTRKASSAASYVAKDGSIGRGPGWNLDLVDHINNSVDILTSPNLASSVAIRQRALQEAFEIKYGQAVPHYFDTSLERLTIDKVLAKPQEFINQFGAASFDAIKKGKDKGLLKDRYIVDPFVYKNKVTGKLYDTRLRSGKHLAKLFFNNINPLGVFRPIQDVLDDPGVAVVPQGTKIDSKTVIKGRDNIYAFGHIYNLDEAEFNVVKKLNTKKVSAFRAGGSLHETVAINTGQAKIKDPDSAKLSGWLQKKLGIGPAYANRHSLPSLLFRPFKAAKAQAKGQAAVRIKPYIPYGSSTQDEADAVIGAIAGHLREADTRAGSYPLKSAFDKISDYWNKDKVVSKKERILNKFDYFKARLGFQSRNFELYKTDDLLESDLAYKSSLEFPTRDDLFFQRSLGSIESLDSPLPRNPNASLNNATAINRIKALSNEEISKLVKATDDTLSPDDLSLKRQILSNRATTAGGITENLYSKYAFATTGTLAKSAPNFLALRLNALIGTTFGVGIRPSRNVAVNMARIAAIPFGFQGALTTADYVDYLSQRTTGFSPINAVASGYTYAREKQQELREKTGLSDLFAKTEKVAPGLLESGLGYLVRHGIIAASSIGLTLSGRSKLGFLAGLLGYVGIGGANVGQSSEELRAEYSGKKLVEVRKSRFWGFGRQPFEGGRLDYMAPSWYQRLLKRPYMSNIYGSRDAYYAKHANVFGIPFPSIESGFGLRQLLDPYRLEKETYYDRPYPVTGGMFKEFPIFGGLLDATIGQILKPHKRMHGEFYNQEVVGVHTNLYSQHLPNQIAAKIGFGQYNHAGIEPTQAASLKSKFEEISNQITEPVGFYKFLAEKILGILPDQSTFKEADSSSIGSASRSFYDLQLGGLGGLTEFARRFFLPEWGAPNKLNERVNPIGNTMPDWLPGSRSQFQRDKFPWIDFHTGDSYCVSYDTLIDTNLGYKKAGEVNPGDIIYSDKRNWLPVKKVVKRKIAQKEKVFSITIAGNLSIPLEFSEEHPILVAKISKCKYATGGSATLCRPSIRDCNSFCTNKKCNQISEKKDINFVKAKDLKKYDYVVYPIPENTHKNTINISYLYRSASRNKEIIINESVTIDKDFAWLIGLYAAEGSTGKSKTGKPRQLIFSLNINEKDVAEKISKVLMSLFNKQATIKEIPKNNSLSVTLSSTREAQIFEFLCPGNAKNKEFNKQIFDLDTNLLKEILLGYILGDGNINNNIITVSSASERLILDYRFISLKCGIPAGFSQRTRIDSRIGEYTSYESYFHVFQIMNYDISSLMYKLENITNLKNQLHLDSFADSEYIYFKIKNIEEVNIEYVYGFEVDVDDTFCVFGFATHNTKLSGGEWRLPGTGYEKMFGLHSGQPGVYDEIDRFLVLNSVAPFSESYLYYKIRALSKYNSGKLDDYWAGRIEQAIDFESDKKKRFDYYPRLFTKDASSRGNILDFRRDLGEINKDIQFSGPERMMRAGWEILSHDVLQHIPYVGTKLAPFYSPLEHYKKFQIYGSESAMWDNPWADIVRPAIYETAGAPAPMPFVKGAMLGAALGHPASPLRAFNPFPEGSALNNAGLVSKFGIAGSLLGWGKLLLTQDLDSNFIPPHVQKQRETEEYFDKLRYIKSRTIQDAALQQGDTEVADIYKREAASTFAGLTADSTKAYMRRALSRIDRAYFDAFSEAPASERPAILKNVPDYVKPIYQKIWGMDSSLNDRSAYDADADALDYLNTHLMPDKNSIVWHPDVPMQAIKSAFLDSGINGIADSFSKFDIYPRALEETRLSFPDLYNTTPSRIKNSFLNNFANGISSFMNPFDNMRWTIGSSDTSTANLSVIDNGSRKQKYMYMQQAMIYG